MKAYSSSRYYTLAFCCIGFILGFIACYPGFMSIDSFEQYQQVLSGHYDDWHPPIMAGWWWVLNHLWRGPAPMMVFQLLCLWIAVYLLIELLPNKVWKLSVALLALSPFVQNIAGYVIKDAEMALPWLLAFSILLHYELKGKKLSGKMVFFLFILLTYGSWVRTNAFPGVVPLIVWLVWIVYRDNGTLQKTVFSAILLAFVAAGHWIQDTVFDTDATYPEYKLYMQDITGIYVKTGESYYPKNILACKGFDTAILRQHYHPATIDDIIDYDRQIVIPEGNDSTAPAAGKAWKQAVKDHPFVWLENKYEGFLYYLQIKKRSEFDVYYPLIDKNPYGFHLSENKLTKLFMGYIELQSGLPYMQPWFWFFLNYILLLFLWPMRKKVLREGALVLLSSGILYQALMFLVFPVDTQFRYMYWNCIAESLAICMMIADRLKMKN